MLQFIRRTDPHREPSTTLTLSFESRQKSRQRVTLDDGRIAALLLDRGHILRGGECLQGDDGTIVCLIAADEAVSTAYCDDPRLLARICYHLGNRHVPLQIGEGWCRYQHDHVLDDMVRSLGASLQHEQAPFEPESGAYGGHSHHHHDEPATAS